MDFHLSPFLPSLLFHPKLHIFPFFPLSPFSVSIIVHFPIPYLFNLLIPSKLHRFSPFPFLSFSVTVTYIFPFLSPSASASWSGRTHHKEQGRRGCLGNITRCPDDSGGARGRWSGGEDVKE